MLSFQKKEEEKNERRKGKFLKLWGKKSLPFTQVHSVLIF